MAVKSWLRKFWPVASARPDSGAEAPPEELELRGRVIALSVTMMVFNTLRDAPEEVPLDEEASIRGIFEMAIFMSYVVDHTAFQVLGPDGRSAVMKSFDHTLFRKLREGTAGYGRADLDPHVYFYEHHSARVDRYVGADHAARMLILAGTFVSDAKQRLLMSTWLGTSIGSWAKQVPLKDIVSGAFELDAPPSN